MINPLIIVIGAMGLIVGQIMVFIWSFANLGIMPTIIGASVVTLIIGVTN